MMRTTRMSENYEIAWARACELGRFRFADLIDTTGMALSTIQRWVMQWRMDGKVKVNGRSDAGQVFEVIEGLRAGAVRQPSREGPMEKLWRAMRMMREFTAIDLASHACTMDVLVSESDAEEYCRLLARGEYLRVRAKETPTRPARYRLVRDTGPRPPRLRQVRGIYDPNTEEFAQFAGRGK